MKETQATTISQDQERLADALSRCYEEINLLHRIGDLTVNSKNLSQQLNSICKQLRKVIECDHVAIIWTDLSDKNSTSNTQPEVFQEGKYLLAANSLSAIWQEARNISSNQNNNYNIENIPENASSKLNCNISNYLIAPIMTNHGTVGSISACSKTDNHLFSSIESRLVLSIANKLSTCHENLTLYIHQQELLMGTLKALIRSIDAKDPYTCGHSERVARISRYLAEKLELTDSQIESAYMAGLLHDIGKIGIKGTTLRKDASLSLDEFEEIKQHPIIGANILKGIRQMSEVVLGVKNHHERYDGKGYPAGLSGKNIPVIGRIVKIADTVDAMMSTRTYRKSMPIRKVLSEIARFSGTQFDPEISDVLLRSDLNTLRKVINSTENEDFLEKNKLGPGYIIPPFDNIFDDTQMVFNTQKHNDYFDYDNYYLFKSEYCMPTQ